MSTFRELKEFERNFATMTVAELERWRDYWTRHAEQLAPKARKQAVKRVYDIEKAIEQKGGNEPTGPMPTVAETCADTSLSAEATKKARARPGRIMCIERKAGGLTGAARISRVTFSKTGAHFTTVARGFRASREQGSSPTITTWTPARTTGFPARNAMAAMRCTAAAHLSRLMKTFARSIGGISEAEVIVAPPAAERLNDATWKLALDLPVQTKHAESLLHAVERVPPQTRGKPAK
jgi:hypothetical protein